MTIQVYRQTSIPTYLSGLTNLPTYKSIYLGWLTNQGTSIIYPGWLNDQHTWLSIWVDCMTNIPAYLSGLTNRPIIKKNYLTIQVYWQTSIQTYLSGLTKTYQQTSLSMWVDWLAYLSRLSDWLPIWVDCTTIIPAYLSRLTVRATFLTIYPGWLTNQQISQSILVD